MDLHVLAEVEFVRKDLATDLAAHSFGVVYFMAKHMFIEVNFSLEELVAALSRTD
jgi:hypothetical protein